MTEEIPVTENLQDVVFDDEGGPTPLQRMTAAGWLPEERRIVAQQCLLGQAQSIRAGRPDEARRLGKIIDMLSEIAAEATP